MNEKGSVPIPKEGVCGCLPEEATLKVPILPYPNLYGKRKQTEQTCSSAFRRASRAGDAALAPMWEALRAESDQGSALTSVTCPGRFRASILPTSAQGSGPAASLAPHSWHEQTGRIATKPQASPEMLDEPPALSSL
jgi:hypothetical protein